MRITVKVAGYVWRPLTASEADTEFVLGLRNSPVARAAFFTDRLTREDHLLFLKRADERGEVNWIIELAGTRVGSSGIFNIDWKNNRAMGRGAATIPEVHLLIMFVCFHVGFEVLGLHRMHGEALASNTVSNRALERLGGIKEGVLREHVCIGGTHRDVCLYGLLASDWRQLKSGLYARFGEPEVSRETGEDVC